MIGFEPIPLQELWIHKNSALNNSIDLAIISRGFMALKMNKTGFFWKKTGLFGIDGEECIVPLVKKEKIL